MFKKEQKKVKVLILSFFPFTQIYYVSVSLSMKKGHYLVSVHMETAFPASVEIESTY